MPIPSDDYEDEDIADNHESDKRTNTCSIIALFSALVGLALPAIVFGAIGIVQVAARRHRETGEGMAFAGFIIGILEAITMVVLFLTLANFN